MNSQIENNSALYLENSVRGILEALICNIIKQKPDNEIKFMIDWLKHYLGVEESNVTNSEIEESMVLRKEIKGYMRKYPKAHIEEGIDSDQEEENINDKQDNDVDNKIGKVIQRLSVSAEAYGEYNKREEYVPLIIQKTEEQKERIKNKMLSNFLFNQLDEKELKDVIDSFEEKAIEANDIIIKEGDTGDVVYLLDSGEAFCYKKNSNGGNSYIKTYTSGESFGELALLYNAPRAATIITKTGCSLWALERRCFNSIIKSAAISRREEYEKVLRGVELFQTMNQYEISQLCDALKTERIKAGTKIISQNEDGNTFFILEQGEAYATKTIKDKEETVLKYANGSYFGELALLKNEPRAANVYAKTDCKVLILERMAFARLLGSLEVLLTRNSEVYVNYVKQINQ